MDESNILSFVNSELRAGQDEPTIQSPAPSQPESLFPPLQTGGQERPAAQSQPSRPFLADLHGGLEAEPVNQDGSSRTKHSLTKCACKKCQQRRSALAMEFGVTLSSEVDEYDEEIFDAKTVGKIVTSFHTYRYLSLMGIDKRVAKAWEVSEESEEAFGKLGQNLLKKYLGRIDFKYKQELILGLYLGSDLGVRMLHEKKIISMLQEAGELHIQDKEK